MSVILSDEVADEVYSLLEKEYGDSRDGDIEKIFDVLLRKEYCLFGFKNKENPSDIKFVWACDDSEAQGKMEYEVDDLDEYEMFQVEDIDGNEVIRVANC